MSASQPAYFNLQEFSDGGVLLVGGRLYTYTQGTTSLKTAYTDPAGAVPQTYTADGLGGQFIALNARGELPSPLYLSPGPYDIALKRADGSTVWTRRADPVGDIAATLATPSGADLVGFIQAGVGAVARTTQDELRESITPFQFMTPALIADAKLPVPILDHAAALQAAATAAAGKTLVLGPYNFRCTAGLSLAGSLDGAGAAIKFVGATISRLISQSVEGDVTNLTIDGAGVTNCEFGLFVDTDFVQTKTSRYSNLKIKNIANADNTKGCNGVIFYKGSLAVNLGAKLEISNIEVDGVTATANAVIGDTGGSSTGIFVSFNGTGTDCQVVIRDAIVKNILPAEDSGGIQLYVGDHAVVGALGTYLVQNCKIYNAKKRGVKVQAQNATISKVVVYGQTTEVGFDSYAINTMFEDCRYVSGNSTAFRTQGASTAFVRCNGAASTQQPLLRLEAGATNPLVRDSSFANSAVLASVANNLVLISGVPTCVFENVGVAGTTNTGSAFSISGTCDVRFRGGAISGTDYGVYLGFSSGTFGFSEGAAMSVNSFGFFRTGATAQVVVCNDATINAAIAFNLVSGGAAATVDLNNTKIGTTLSAILASAGSRVVDCQLTNPGVTGTAISAGNSVSRGNRISGYAVGVSYTFTTTAEVANNVTIGTTLPYETTGFTAFVNNDNFSR